MRKEDRKLMVVEASKPLFAKKGFHGTSISDILKASSIAQGTLYLHFKNKEEIFTAMIIDVLNKMSALNIIFEKQDNKKVTRQQALKHIENQNHQIIVVMGD